MGSSLTTDVAFQPPSRSDTKAFFAQHAQTLLARDGVTFGRCGATDGAPASSSVSYLVFPVPEPKGAVLLCHGNAEDLGVGYLGFRQLAGYLRKVGAVLIVFDYSGYGCSGGDKPSEKQCYADAEAVLQMIQTERRIPRRSIVLMGRSLGSGPATEMATRYNDFAGLMLISPIASAVSVLGKRVRYALRTADIFRNLAKIDKVTYAPVLVVHGQVDQVVPFWHGEELYNLLIESHRKLRKSEEKQRERQITTATSGSSSISTRTAQAAVETYSVRIEEPADERASVLEGFVQRLWLPNCDHNDIESVAGARFYNAVTQFVDYALNRSPS